VRCHRKVAAGKDVLASKARHIRRLLALLADDAEEGPPQTSRVAITLMQGEVTLMQGEVTVMQGDDNRENNGSVLSQCHRLSSH